MCVNGRLISSYLILLFVICKATEGSFTQAYCESSKMFIYSKMMDHFIDVMCHTEIKSVSVIINFWLKHSDIKYIADV